MEKNGKDQLGLILGLIFNMVNATFTAHCYGIMYKLLCYFASMVWYGIVEFNVPLDTV